MPYQNQILRTDLFSGWLEKDNEFVGETIPTYLLDSTNPPSTGVVYGKNASIFSPTGTGTIYFDFVYDNKPADVTYAIATDDVSNTNRNIRLSFTMDNTAITGTSDGVKLHLDYSVQKEDDVTDFTTYTGTSQTIITTATGTGILAKDSTLTITGTGILDGTSEFQLISCKLSRLGGNVSDTHIGGFVLYDIEII